MSKRHRKQRTLNGNGTLNGALTQRGIPQVQAAVGSSLGGWDSAFEAARRTGFRGYFYFPGLDPGKQMLQWTRETIAEKSNWLYNNVGCITAVIDGLSLDEVETGLWPRAASSNEAFNRVATDRFDESWKDPRFFDAAKVENAYTAQLAIRRHIRIHGGLFAQLLRPGDDFRGPRLNFVPSWQVRNANTAMDQSRWKEGQMFDRFGACIMYRVVTNPEGTAWVDVPAEDMLHFHDAFWIRQKRGMPSLSSVARKLFTLDEVEKAMANGIQLRTFMAYAITKKEGDTGAPTLIPGVSSQETVETPEGGSLVIQKMMAPNGNEVSVAEPPPGRDIKVLESTAANEPLGFKRDVLTDVAYSQLYPPDYVFALAGGTLGTEVRWKVRRVQNVKNSVRWFQLIPQFLEPAYRFKTWQDIKAGLFDGVPGGIPQDWWRYKAICPPDTSVDIGREGKLYDERVATGKMDPDDHAGMQGKDAGDLEDSILRTRTRRDRKLKAINEERAQEGLEPLKYEQLWPANSNAAAASVARTGEGSAPNASEEEDD